MRQDTRSFTEEDQVNIDNDDDELQRAIRASREVTEREEERRERVLHEQREREHQEALEEQLEIERVLLRSKEEEERLARQLIREEQDRAYQESLENDRAKEEAKLREEQEKQKQEQERLEKERLERETMEQEQELMDAIQLSQILTEERRQQDLQNRVKTLPPEPSPSDPNAIRLVMQLPSGARIERFFNLGDTFGDVRTFVDTRRLEENGKLVVPVNYNLVTYPRQVWGDMNMKLVDTPFRKRELIRVEEI